MRVERSVLRNNSGVSLIEILFAVLIMSIVGVALLTTSTVSMSKNMQNDIRNEAVNSAQERMTLLRTLSFTETVTDAALNDTGGADVPDPVSTGTTRTIGNITVTYNRTLRITDVGTGAKQITVTVGWNYRGQPFTYSLTSLIKRAK